MTLYIVAGAVALVLIGAGAYFMSAKKRKKKGADDIYPLW